MTWCEAILANDAAINAETDTLKVIAPTSLTTRTGHGDPLLKGFAAWASTDDISKVYAVPNGFSDQNGIPCPCLNKYGATASFDLRKAMLANPVRIPQNRLINIYATSETAADSVVTSWMWLEYPSGGACVKAPSGEAMVRRAWEHGAALVSNTAANSTDITSLVSGRKYYLAGVGQAAVNGATAGCVGPAFIKIRNAEYQGAEAWLPLVNNASYSAANGGGYLDLIEMGLLQPVIDGGNILQTACVGYTAEQPQAQLMFIVDKV